MSINYIGADVHAYNTEICVEKGNEIVNRYSVPTTISAIREVLKSIPGKKQLAIEEGPMAGWLYRNLKDHVDKMVVCDPRRNRYIYADGDVDDDISGAKLAELLRGGYLREVYHSEDEQQIELKHWVGLYHDRVHAGVGQISKIRSRCWMYGVKIPRRVIHDASARQEWFQNEKQPVLARQLHMLCIGFDATTKQVKVSKRQVTQLGKKHKIIEYWNELPGFGLVRSTTLFAYLDTPWRFKKKTKLWRYCGLGIHRVTSGKDKRGRPKPPHLALDRNCNRKLKDVVMGAAITAIHTTSANIFKDYYERLRNEGVIESNARHSVARMLVTVAWGMWKSMSRFNPSLYDS